MPTLVSTTLEVCGAPWLIAVLLVALVNLGVALKLTFGSRSVVALVAFMPVAFLPLGIGIIGSLISLTQAIEVGMDPSASPTVSQGNEILVAMALLPVAVGGALAVPSYAAAAFGRFWLATRAAAPSSISAAATTTNASLSTSSGDEMAYQAYADLVTTAGHRKSK